MSVQEIIKLINKDEITELNQVNEKFILNDEILKVSPALRKVERRYNKELRAGVVHRANEQ